MVDMDRGNVVEADTECILNFCGIIRVVEALVLCEVADGESMLTVSRGKRQIDGAPVVLDKAELARIRSPCDAHEN